ncbi:MAG: hypothetical protein KF687_09985 [Cyclobacteriaceae bacterium]|nr:hypothetical protein [Cyclobacteriaceae bacterium]
MLLSVSSCLYAQDTDAFLYKQDSLLTFSDSLDIFRLIDSLMNLEALNTSQLALRLAYNSNVLWAGRTLGIDQFGLGPAISYYHKSGLFADLSSFWSKDLEPKYYLTILTGGYIHSFSKKFSMIASYDHYFYNLEDSYIPYSNAITITPFYEIKPVNIRLDYTFFFGDYSVHRIMPSVGLTLKKENVFKKIDRVSLMPTIFVLFGDQVFNEIVLPSTRQEWIAAIIRVRQGLPWYTIETRRVFGLMNYALTAPLSIRHNQWNFTASYTYNIPKALPGESLTLDNSSFLSASFTWFFDLKRKKSPL